MLQSYAYYRLQRTDLGIPKKNLCLAQKYPVLYTYHRDFSYFCRVKVKSFQSIPIMTEEQIRVFYDRLGQGDERLVRIFTDNPREGTPGDPAEWQEPKHLGTDYDGCVHRKLLPPRLLYGDRDSETERRRKKEQRILSMLDRLRNERPANPMEFSRILHESLNSMGCEVLFGYLNGFLRGEGGNSVWQVVDEMDRSAGGSSDRLMKGYPSFIVDMDSRFNVYLRWDNGRPIGEREEPVRFATFQDKAVYVWFLNHPGKDIYPNRQDRLTMEQLDYLYMKFSNNPDVRETQRYRSFLESLYSNDARSSRVLNGVAGIMTKRLSRINDAIVKTVAGRDDPSYYGIINEDNICRLYLRKDQIWLQNSVNFSLSDWEKAYVRMGGNMDTQAHQH